MGSGHRNCALPKVTQPINKIEEKTARASMVFFPLSSFFPILCDLLDEILSLLPLLSSFLLFFSHDPSTARSNVGMKSERRPETGPDSPHHLCILACISQPPPPSPSPFAETPFSLALLLAFLPRECPIYIHVSSVKRYYFVRLLSVSRLSSSISLVW